MKLINDRFVRDVWLIRKLNSAYYHYRCNRWRWNPTFRKNVSRIPVPRPIFLIGTQGAGLTLLSRILRRSPEIVGVSGNHQYWGGADETQNILQSILPKELTWLKIQPKDFCADTRNWLYATDELLPYYRLGPDDATVELQVAYTEIVRRILAMNAPRGSDLSRFCFLDKSQSYTVKVGFLNRLLKENDPRFVLLLRNPYAMIWRAVMKDFVVSKLPLDERGKARIAVEHWRNSYEEALKYEHSAKMIVRRFEDLLADPERIVGEICSHVGIDFDLTILPQHGDRIPFGSMYDAFNKRKWYPLRPSVSRTYLESMPSWAIDYVSSQCGDLIQRFNYEIG